MPCDEGPAGVGQGAGTSLGGVVVFQSGRMVQKMEGKWGFQKCCCGKRERDRMRMGKGEIE